MKYLLLLIEIVLFLVFLFLQLFIRSDLFNQSIDFIIDW